MNSHALTYRSAKESCEKEQTFVELHNRYKEMVHNMAVYYTHCHSMAEDISQDVFLKLWRVWPRLDGVEFLDSYVASTTRNTCFNVIKKNKRELQGKNNYIKAADTGYYDVEERLLAKEYKKIWGMAIEKLPPRRKQVYYMYSEIGLNYRYIARLMKTSPSTVKNHRAKALKEIRSLVAKSAELRA